MQFVQEARVIIYLSQEPEYTEENLRLYAKIWYSLFTFSKTNKMKIMKNLFKGFNYHFTD